jgi:predicted phage tail protein
LIRATSATNQQPCIELVAPDNSRSTACNLLGSNLLQLTLLQAGTYIVLMRQGNNIPFASAWSYTLELRCTAGACFSAPNPPTGLTGVVSTVATTLMWNVPATGPTPTSYVIEAGTSAGGTDVVVFDTLSTATTFVAPGVPNGSYFVRVRSRNSVGTSSPSNEIVITGASGCPLPSAPATFTASAAGSVVSLAWTAAAGNATSYILEAGTSAGASNLANADLGLATQFMTVAPNGTYFLRIRARNACGLGPASHEVTLIVGCNAPPDAPANLVATVTGSTVLLSWPAATGQAASYAIEAGSAAGLSNLAQVDVGGLLAFTANAPPGTYFVRVRATNACGTGPPTVERTVIVP